MSELNDLIDKSENVNKSGPQCFVILKPWHCTKKNCFLDKTSAVRTQKHSDHIRSNLKKLLIF